MAFSATTKVRVADGSSEYRGHKGVVQSVSADLHQVRLDGHGCGNTVALRTDQLKEDFTAHSTSYAQC